MTQPHFPIRSNIDDELLSAYIDGQVTAAERQRVEQALAADTHIRERYETLRMTVNLMQNTPPVRVPHAFVLSEAQVLAAGGKVKGVDQPGFWERFFPRLMPLATTAVAILLVVLVGVDLFPGLAGRKGAPQPAVQEMEIAAAPAREEPAPLEIPAESLAAKTVEMTVVVEKLAKREAEKSSPQDDTTTGDSAMAESNAASVEGTAITPVVAEAPLAAAQEKMVTDEAEPMLETAGTFAETPAAESTASAPALNVAQTTPPADKNKEAAWLRPLEFTLALMFVIFLVVTILLHKQRHTDAP
jgi:anti-sigma factor RsiW